MSDAKEMGNARNVVDFIKTMEKDSFPNSFTPLPSPSDAKEFLETLVLLFTTAAEQIHYTDRKLATKFFEAAEQFKVEEN